MKRAEVFLNVFDANHREIASKPGVWNFRSRSRSPLVTEYVRTKYVTATTVQTAKRSEEHTSELQSRPHLVCRLLLEKKKKRKSMAPLTSTITHIDSGRHTL